MKRAKLLYPTIFHEWESSEKYYMRYSRCVKSIGKKLVIILKNSGFSGGNVLDAGCGFASVAIEVAKAFPNTKVTGIDLSSHLLDLGRSLVSRAGLNEQITLLKGDICNLEFEDNSFDLIINTFLLHIIKEPKAMLNEMERVAKADATILISDLYRGPLAFLFRPLRSAFTVDEAALIFQRSNLKPGSFSTRWYWWNYQTRPVHEQEEL